MPTVFRSFSAELPHSLEEPPSPIVVNDCVAVQAPRAQVSDRMDYILAADLRDLSRSKHPKGYNSYLPIRSCTNLNTSSSKALTLSRTSKQNSLVR